MDKINNISPLRYPGGKTRARKKIDAELNNFVNPEKFDTLISPYFGGGSFEFYFQNKYGKNIKANDLFHPLYNFWKNVKNNKCDLVKLIKSLHPVTKDKFNEYRKTIMESSTDSLHKAAYYFIINRSSFSGATLSGGFSTTAAEKRFTKSSIQRVKNINLKFITFNNMDGIDFINENHTIKSLLFLDPPYYLEKRSKLYGKSGNMHYKFNHIALKNTLDNHINWILCYNNCEFIRNLYKKYKIIEKKWSYGMNKDKKSSELLIINLVKEK